MESTQELLERRYANRAVSRRKAEADAREATRDGRRHATAEAFSRATQDLGACAEIVGIASDLSIDLDDEAIAEHKRKIESESEQAAQALGEEI